MNDIDEFERMETPRGQRSKLDDHREDILQLRQKRYTLRQIQTFLSDRKNVSISGKGICVWLKKNSICGKGEVAQDQARTIENIWLTSLAKQDRTRRAVDPAPDASEKVKRLDDAFRSLDTEESAPTESLIDRVRKAELGNSR